MDLDEVNVSSFRVFGALREIVLYTLEEEFPDEIVDSTIGCIQDYFKDPEEQSSRFGSREVIVRAEIVNRVNYSSAETEHGGCICVFMLEGMIGNNVLITPEALI